MTRLDLTILVVICAAFGFCLFTSAGRKITVAAVTCRPTKDGCVVSCPVTWSGSYLVLHCDR